MTFDDYLRLHRLKLVRFAAVLIGDGPLAEDVVQTVLARAYEQWHRVSAAQSVHAYVRRMVVNEYLSWRRKWQRVIATRDMDDLVPLVPDHAEQHTDHLTLLELVNRLPKLQRATVVLRFYEGMTNNEIAETLGCGKSTVRSNVSRALVALRVEAERSSIQFVRAEA